MGSLRLTLCTGLLTACALIPVAHAADGDGRDVTVTPSTPAAGADVALRVSGCSGRTATAVSAAFVADAQLAGADGTLAGETRIRTSVEPGPYDVKITCADLVIKGRITVVSQSQSRPPVEARPQSHSKPHSQSEPEPQPAVPSTVYASPIAPVDAGGGGAAHFATVDARATGPNTWHAVTGLVLAGAAAAAVGLLRARRSRGTG
ncbi:hypothetical protein ACFY1L_45470 [Streptomyces sp. NPDC001663]|uniref:hypothetical protein n=1 Tax=Streptomyces sp. NPDC001663 TaxID=3364597 RepID=UPI0036835158